MGAPESAVQESLKKKSIIDNEINALALHSPTGNARTRRWDTTEAWMRKKGS